MQRGHRLPLPGHLFAGLFLRVEAAEKKLQIRNGSRLGGRPSGVGGGRAPVDRVLAQPQVPGWEVLAY